MTVFIHVLSFPVASKDLCIKGAQSLHTKSSLVEEAANELINMLLEFEQHREEEEKVPDESRTESKMDHVESEGTVLLPTFDTILTRQDKVMLKKRAVSSHRNL